MTGDTTTDSIVLEVVRDLLKQQVPGSVVLLIVGLCLMPYVYRAIKWYSSRRNSRGT